MNFVFWAIFLHFSEKLKSSELLDKAKFMPVFLFFFQNYYFFGLNLLILFELSIILENPLKLEFFYC